MGIFVSTYVTKLDQKNRLCVPAPFRAIIGRDGEGVLYGCCSLSNASVEVYTEERMKKLQNYMESFDIFSKEREALETVIFGGADVLDIDSKGRMVLSERLIKFMGIEQEAAFVGKGRTFEIWSKENLDGHMQKARDFMIEHKLTLKQKEL